MKFTKMQGIGNDYIYVDCFQEKVDHPDQVARLVSDRRFGIGGDGLILICPSDKADCRMEMYNADGSQGAMCGNGIRCVGKYVYDHGLVPEDRETLTVETDSGLRTLILYKEQEEGRMKAKALTVDMGRALLTSHSGGGAAAGVCGGKCGKSSRGLFRGPGGSGGFGKAGAFF